MAEPLKVSGAPPQSLTEATAYLMEVALQFGNNQCTGYITVGITKLLVYNHYNTIYGDFTCNYILMIWSRSSSSPTDKVGLDELLFGVMTIKDILAETVE